MEFETFEVSGIATALHGMRNPLSSWHLSDSKEEPFSGGLTIGPKDKDLALRLIHSGPEHAKFLRQIFVSVDITAPRYWWMEFDTYRAGVEKNSCSTMHTIHKKPFEPEDFATKELISEKWSEADSPLLILTPMDTMRDICSMLNRCRRLYLESKEHGDAARAKMFWKQMIILLPQSYLQKRTVTMSYAALANICRQRKGHKLTEWAKFIEWAQTLPESWMIFGGDDNAGRCEG